MDTIYNPEHPPMQLLIIYRSKSEYGDFLGLFMVIVSCNVTFLTRTADTFSTSQHSPLSNVSLLCTAFNC